MSDKKPTVTIYTDGGADPNPGPGGWAALLLWRNGKVDGISGAERDTTNNRMELTAAIEALRALEQPSKVTLRTDSRYLQQGISAWLPNWVKRGWRKADKRPVLNEDLWRALHAEAQRHEIKWQWVKGHAGEAYNEQVDEMVRDARRLLLREMRREQPSAGAPALPPVDIEIALRLAALGYRKPTGWAAQLGEGGATLSGALPPGSGNSAILTAALAALRGTPPGASVRVYCKDAYLLDGMTKWTASWQRNDWRTVDGKSVKYRWLWEDLLAESARRTVEWTPEPPNLSLAEGLHQVAKRTVEQG